MNSELRLALDKVGRRAEEYRLWKRLSLLWLVWAIAGLACVILAFKSSFDASVSGWVVTFYLIASLATAIACFIFSGRSISDRVLVARLIEAKYPELGTGLLTAVQEDAKSEKLGFLQTAVVRQAIEHNSRNDWPETIPTRSLRFAKRCHTASLCLWAIIGFILVVRTFTRENTAPSTLSQSLASSVQVDPGNAEIERGSNLLVVARFEGEVPGEANLVVESSAHEITHRAMTRSLDDPTFAATVESVGSEVSYRVEYAKRSTRDYHVKVFEFPELRRTDAKLVFPTYTDLKPKTIEDIRHVTAVEGTELTLLCRLNKDVAAARLIDEHGQVVELKAGDADHVYRASIKLEDPRRFRLQLVDLEGRANKLPAEIALNVTRNRIPVVTMTQPTSDVRVSPVEELHVKAQIEDDFGVIRHGINYSLAGDEPRDLDLKSTAPVSKRVLADSLIDFESLAARPDQLVTYYFWAEDIGPDGQPRRTGGDMFFAEVRHFEEIFRQGEQAPAASAENENEQEGAGQQSEKLAELQKEIINGTWKLIRRETESKPTPKLVDDTKVLAESQRSAIELAVELAKQIRDAASKASLDSATKFMKDAEKQLDTTIQQSSVATLAHALASERSAYQALLKLRAREFEVSRNNSRQRQRSRSNGGNPSQRQLQQLELSADENRYEQQKSARSQQEKLTKREQDQRESRQVLNRLRELAQRQTDLNQRLKELQSALESSKDQQVREEIQRQLKRLREQEQQILRDTDELRERMEQEENRERMAEARKDLEQGREHVRQASEALESGRVSQAITEGARAGRQLNDLREQIRKASSDQFSEAMTDLRNRARKLNENQDQLSQQLDAWNEKKKNTLRDDGEREKMRQGLLQETKDVDDLLELMRNTVQEAEETEPLLAKELFESVRKADEKKVTEAIKDARRMVDLGIAEEASKSSRHAGEGIGQLREGIERAARSVVGDDTGALKRAQDEVERLAEQVDREIADATKKQPANTPNGDKQDSARSAASNDDTPSSQTRLAGVPKGSSSEQNVPTRDGLRTAEDDSERQKEQQTARQSSPARSESTTAAGRGISERELSQQDPQNGNQQVERQGDPSQGQQSEGDGTAPATKQANRDARGGLGGNLRKNQSGDRGSSSPGAQSLMDEMLNGLTAGPGGPITGEGFRQWSDRMRDVEEILENPEMRAEAAVIRDRVRGAREDFKRHSKDPDWTKLKQLVAEPIRELQQRISEEIRRRETPDSLVPIDRDPVPPAFTEAVRRYYERLGSGR